MCVLLAGFSVASVVVLAGVPDTPALIISGALDKLVPLTRGWMKDALSPPLAYLMRLLRDANGCVSDGDVHTKQVILYH